MGPTIVHGTKRKFTLISAKWIKHNKMRRFIIMIIAIIICCYSVYTSIHIPRLFLSLSRQFHDFFFAFFNVWYSLFFFFKKSHIIQTVFCLDFLCVPFNLIWSFCLCGVRACVCVGVTFIVHYTLKKTHREIIHFIFIF